jgi:hypothetical protein
MVLILHISIALFSILFATYTLVLPTKSRVSFAYGTVFATLATGTYLVVSTGSALLSACITGIIYTTIVSLAIHLAKMRLQAKTSRIK